MVCFVFCFVLPDISVLLCSMAGVAGINMQLPPPLYCTGGKGGGRERTPTPPVSLLMLGITAAAAHWQLSLTISLSFSVALEQYFVSSQMSRMESPCIAYCWQIIHEIKG